MISDLNLHSRTWTVRKSTHYYLRNILRIKWQISIHLSSIRMTIVMLCLQVHQQKSILQLQLIHSSAGWGVMKSPGGLITSVHFSNLNDSGSYAAPLRTIQTSDVFWDKQLLGARDKTKHGKAKSQFFSRSCLEQTPRKLLITSYTQIFQNHRLCF